MQHTCRSVIELYTEWAGPTAAAKTAWRKLAVDMGGGPLPFDLRTLCLDRMQGAPGAELLAALPLTSEPQWVLVKHGKQVTCIRAGQDITTLSNQQAHALRHVGDFTPRNLSGNDRITNGGTPVRPTLQVAVVMGMDLPQLMKAVQKFSAETVAVARETEC